MYKIAVIPLVRHYADAETASPILRALARCPAGDDLASPMGPIAGQQGITATTQPSKKCHRFAYAFPTPTRKPRHPYPALTRCRPEASSGRCTSASLQESVTVSLSFYIAQKLLSPACAKNSRHGNRANRTCASRTTQLRSQHHCTGTGLCPSGDYTLFLTCNPVTCRFGFTPTSGETPPQMLAAPEASPLAPDDVLRHSADPILSGQNTELSTRTRLLILSRYLPGKPRRNDFTSSALLRKVAEADYESPRGDAGVLQKNGLPPFFLVLSLLVCTPAHSAGVKSMRLLMTRAPNHPKTILCRESSGSCGAWRHTRRVSPLSSPITICRTARISFAIC